MRCKLSPNNKADVDMGEREYNHSSVKRREQGGEMS